MEREEANASELSASDRTTLRLREQFADTGGIISVAGPDGSGKTTLTEQLAKTFEQAGLPVQRIHCYAWYKNIFVMPFRLKHLRDQKCVVILDRCIYDNVIELARKASLAPPASKLLLKMINSIYIRFDWKIVLSASLEDLSARRPGEDPARLSGQINLYESLTRFSGYSLNVSGPNLLTEVLTNQLTTP